MPTVKRIGVVIVVLTGVVLAAVPPATADISVSATVQPRVIPVGSEATMVVTVKGKFRKSSQPELPSINGLTFYQAGSSQSFSIVNGQATSSLQFNYVVLANKEGRYTIEPIRFEAGGDIHTAPPVEIEVVKGAAQLPAPTVETDGQEESSDSPIFIRAWADRDTVYVNEQVTWTLGFYTDGRVDLLRSPEYSPPSAEGFWVEDLPPQKNYYKMIDGTRYLVNEIKRGFFPTAPGNYEIGAARVEIVLDDNTTPRIDDFFSRRLRTFGFGKPKTLTTSVMPVAVLPLPKRGRPGNFSGLVGRDLNLTLQTDKQVVAAGDPVNVTLEITGEGNFNTMAAPDIPEMTGFKTYESGATSDLYKNDYVVSGRKRIEFVLIPQIEGETVIPPVQMSYFDPRAEAYKTIQSAPVQMTIKPGTKEKGGRQVVFTGSGQDIEVLGRDIHFIRPVPAEISIGHRGVYRGGLFVALHAVPMLAVMMSFVIARRRRRWMDDAPAYRARRASREADKRLRGADDLIKNDHAAEVYAAVSSAMRGYIADKMNRPAPGLTDEAIIGFLRAKSVADGDIDRLFGVLKICDGARYSTEAVTMDVARKTREEAGGLIETLEKGGLG